MPNQPRVVTTGRAGVYSIAHTESGRIYVGSAVDLGGRWRRHRSKLRRGVHDNPILQAAWTKYGESAFVFAVLEFVSDRAVLREREQHWIDQLGAARQGTGFNIQPSAYDRRGVPCSEGTKARLRQIKQGNQYGVGHHEHGKLTESDVVSILQRFAAGAALDDLTVDFNVTRATVYRIVKRDIWWHVALPPDVEAARLARRSTRQQGSRNNSKPKLNESNIPQIRARLAAGESCESVAHAFGVSRTCISAIKGGRSWTHVL